MAARRPASRLSRERTVKPLGVDSLTNRIAALEARIERLVTAAEDGQTHGCTHGCTGTCPDPTGDCTYGCTDQCTNGCTNGCRELVSERDILEYARIAVGDPGVA
jgi:hypothetical protein